MENNPQMPTQQQWDHPLQTLLAQSNWNHANDAMLLQALQANPIIGQWLKSLASDSALISLTEPISLHEDSTAVEARRLVWSRAQLSVFTTLLQTVALAEQANQLADTQ